MSMTFIGVKARIGTYMPPSIVGPRQDTGAAPTTTPAAEPPREFVEENGRYVWYWYTREGLIIKWSLFLGFVVILGGYLVIGHIHAKRRMRKGLKPLFYHRWLVSRHDRARVDPSYAYPQSSLRAYPPPPNGQGSYGMQNMGIPPPVYDPNRPPIYEGESKVNPNQEYTAPLGPPPAPLSSDKTGGSSNPFDDPTPRR